MKFQIFSAAIAGLALAACGGADTDPVNTDETTAESTSDAAQEAAAGDMSALEADCQILASDPEAQESFMEMGTDTEGFCGCFVQLIENSPEEERTQMLATLEDVTDGMEATGEGAEEVVSGMMSDTMMNPESEAAQSAMTGVRMIGEVIDRVSNGFEDTGACPAS